MARKPKVYAADIDGVHEWIVAAPNQSAALEAFGVNQNLFQQGLAHATDDVKAVEAASAAPGTPLRRPKGSDAAFRPVDADSGAETWEKAAKAAGVKAPRASRKKPDRSALDAAEAALSAFETEAAEETDRIEEEERAIKARRQAAARAQKEQRKALREAVASARTAFERQG